MSSELTAEVLAALAAPFREDEIDFLPRSPSNGRALGLAYIDARTVMNRLDWVVGPAHWSFDFDVLSPDGKLVRGKLTILGVTKCDAGEAAQEEEPLKSAVSDALKRAAVHFGIGRYLYYLPRVWAPYDAQKRRFVEPPRLDPRAVQEALRLCGVGSAERPGNETSAGKQRAEQHVKGAEGQRSVWSASAPAPAPESSGDAAASREGVVCSVPGCAKLLTKGQQDVSLRAYGEPLCPACQKDRSRKGA